MNQPNSELEEAIRALEPPYRSRGEAQVGRLLDRYGIPFFYEQPTLVYDHGRHRVWHPDFSLPGYGSMIIEYAGMPDVQEYRQRVERKQQVYKANGIPAVFVYPDDLTGPVWAEALYHRIEQAGRQAAQIGQGVAGYEPTRRYG